MKINARFAVMAASVAVLMAAAPIAQAATSPGISIPWSRQPTAPTVFPVTASGRNSIRRRWRVPTARSTWAWRRGV